MISSPLARFPLAFLIWQVTRELGRELKAPADPFLESDEDALLDDDTLLGMLYLGHISAISRPYLGYISLLDDDTLLGML